MKRFLVLLSILAFAVPAFSWTSGSAVLRPELADTSAAIRADIGTPASIGDSLAALRSHGVFDTLTTTELNVAAEAVFSAGMSIVGDITQSGEQNVTGTISATAFVGDGSGLTSVGAAAATSLSQSAKAAENIDIGEAVYISDASAELPEVSLADNTDAAKSDVWGIAVESKTTGQTISIRVIGELSSLNTSGFSDGDELWLGTAGALVATRPTSGAIKHVAVVTFSDASSGKIVFDRDDIPALAAAASQDVLLRAGDSAGSNSFLFHDYANNEIGSIDSDGNTQFDGTLESYLLASFDAGVSTTTIDGSGLATLGSLNVTDAATFDNGLTSTLSSTFSGGLTATTAAFSSTISAATGSTIGDLTLADGSITSSGAAIDFGAENLSTTGTLSAGATTVTQITNSGAIYNFGAGSLYLGSSNGAGQYGYIEWDDTNKRLKFTGTQGSADVLILEDTAATFSGTVAGAFNGTLGATTPAAATVTTLDASDTITLEGGSKQIKIGLAASPTTEISIGAPGYAPYIGHNFEIPAGSWIRSVADYSTAINVNATGGFTFDTAVSSTAGSAISWNTRMAITNAGAVGIGTASPSYTLDVAGNTRFGTDGGTVTVLLAGDSSTTGGFIYQDSTPQMIISEVAAGPILFRTSNTERMRLDASGNLLPGTTETQDLGSSSLEWDNLYVQNSPTVSDERRKNLIGPIDNASVFLRALEPQWGSYKDTIIPAVEEQTDKDGNVTVEAKGEVIISHGRPHTFLVAQQVKAAMDAVGIDDWAGYAYDEDVDLHTLRLNEAVPLLIAGWKQSDEVMQTFMGRDLTREQTIKKLEARVAELEAKLAA